MREKKHRLLPTYKKTLPFLLNSPKVFRTHLLLLLEGQEKGVLVEEGGVNRVVHHDTLILPKKMRSGM